MADVDSSISNVCVNVGVALRHNRGPIRAFAIFIGSLSAAAMHHNHSPISIFSIFNGSRSTGVNCALGGLLPDDDM